MNLDQFMGILRNILIPLGAIAAAHGVAAGTWDGIAGLIVAIAAFSWGVLTHDTTQAMMSSLVRAAIGAVGGVFIQRGWASNDQVTMVVAGTATIVPNVWTWFVHADPDAVSKKG